MPDILIEQVPDTLHAKLCAEAKRHRRSMTQEVLTILEKELGGTAVAIHIRDLPPPVKGKFPLTQSLLTKGIREGRP